MKTSSKVSRLGIGVASVILIIATVFMSLFALLALLQAREESGVSRKTVSAVCDSYVAEGKANEILAELDGILAGLPETADGKEIAEAIAGLSKDTCYDAQNGEIRFSVPVSDGLILAVRLRGISTGGKKARYEIESFCKVSVGEWDPGNYNLK